jgi:hypothetical protein
MSAAEDLGKLIIMMNPYAGDSMELQTFLAAQPPPAPPTTTTGTSPSPPAPPHAPQPPDATCIWMEMDKYGTGDWAFKGQPHRIDTALRIAYRWAKKDKQGNFLCWITDYLLIGYEGSNGG